MRYFLLGDKLYAHSKSTGLDVMYAGGEWRLADTNVFALTYDEGVQEITAREALKISKEAPDAFIERFINSAKD